MNADMHRMESNSQSGGSVRPCVSVVMPAFNAERTIEGAVRSVLGQTFEDLELIVCADACTDGTLARLGHFKDPRLIVIENASNLGEGRSRDRAIAKASGRWLAVIDADDEWLPNRIDRMLEATRGDDVLVFDNIMQCHDSEQRLIPWKPIRLPGVFGPERRGIADVQFPSFIVQHRLLIKPIFPREIVTRQDIRHSTSKIGADNEFFLRIFASGIPIRYVAEPMYLYRLTPGSATNHPEKHRLMRQSIGTGLTVEGFGDAARAAIREKLRQLDRAETYEHFRGAVRSGAIHDAVSVLGAEPWIVGHFFRRLLGDAAYHLHRVWHNGRGRGSR